MNDQNDQLMTFSLPLATCRIKSNWVFYRFHSYNMKLIKFINVLCNDSLPNSSHKSNHTSRQLVRFVS